MRECDNAIMHEWKIKESGVTNIKGPSLGDGHLFFS